MAERAQRGDRERYNPARHLQILYEAAARLWIHGVNMPSAISIVDKAMQDAGEV